uniref:Protein S100 n=1 Tax=Sphenodon punctatus TaxID=8508 RepID=A0A8D0GGU5_SPHPU
GTRPTKTLEQALGVLVCTFLRYARQEGAKCTLNRGELRELLENELQIPPGAFEELMRLLDTNKDQEVDFEEYARFVAAACSFFHQFFSDSPPCQPRIQPCPRHLFS